MVEWTADHIIVAYLLGDLFSVLAGNWCVAGFIICGNRVAEDVHNFTVVPE